MKINTVGQLRKLIEDLEDDYSIEFRVRNKVSDEELIKRAYLYSYDTIYINSIEYDDISVSDKQLCLGVTLED